MLYGKIGHIQTHTSILANSSTNKVSLQTSLERNFSNFSYIFCFRLNFENLLTIVFHVIYVLNMHIKFHSNRMLFTIQSIKLFFNTILDHKT